MKDGLSPLIIGDYNCAKERLKLSSFITKSEN